MNVKLQPHQWTGCHSEYGNLQQVIVCEPKYMAIKEVINDVQKQYASENINQFRAMKQHQDFVRTLQVEGVQVIKVPAKQDFPEQVFTRDIGFTVGNNVFISNMASDVRDGEEEMLRKWLGMNGYAYKRMESGHVEGGDVIVDGKRVFVGVSNRTSRDAITNLQNELPTHDVIAIPFNPKYLHLDCVFNILSPTDALIFRDAMDEKTIELLSKYYRLIDVEADEQFSMGTNVLSIGGNRVISLPVNPKVNASMSEAGYRVIEVDLSEIIKSGGSFRCCTMPLTRK
ncbi:dimethylarginine dimethylaminohydrolase family protein [Paenisporosarcina cavernae]|uniref:N-dimethylarginine dimethylaminohydrolase n=1 Tax=Paenisporosarcina cavernae TaxID=2320858 RepID=A0A385YS06_9BACL|nr:arginine deiminase family protein [Paenisporosarcina cavernae]AYC28528.1 hypothetical protein D3873_01080 [Paenisporosarcina cavernae]